MRTISLNMCVNCKTLSITLADMEIFMSSMRYRIPKILRYNFEAQRNIRSMSKFELLRLSVYCIENWLILKVK